jgi:hypothetical protein
VCIHSNEGGHLFFTGTKVSIRYGNHAQESGKNQFKVKNKIKIPTNCAAMKAARSKRPGRSTKDQLLDLVTKMSA